MASQIIVRSPDLEEHYPTYDLGSLGFEYNKHSYLRIGDRLIFLDSLLGESRADDEPIVKLVYQDSADRHGSSKSYVTIGRSGQIQRLECRKKIITKDISCEESADLITAKWLEFDIDVCPERDSEVGLTPYVAFLPKDVMEELKFVLKPDACDFTPTIN